MREQRFRWQRLRRLVTKSQDQGAERNRRALLTALMNAMSQVVQLATGLISVPLALTYVGPERFGVWMTLSTALAFITFSDLGIGIGVQDRMVKCLGAHDYSGARRSFFSSLAFVALIFVLMMLLGGIAVPRTDLVSFFSLKSAAAVDEIASTTMMVVFCLALGLLSGIVQRAFNALQEGFWVALVQAAARVCSLFLLFIVVHLDLGLAAMVFVVGGLSNTALLLLGPPILLRRHAWLSPVSKPLGDLVAIPALREILRIGSLGLGAAIAIYLVNNSPAVLMARNYGAAGVADFAVLLKLISIPGLMLTYLLLPLWPAITEAKARSDNRWIKDSYGQCARLTLGVTLVSATVVLLFGQKIILFWTGVPSVVPEFGLILASVVFMVLGYWNTLTSMLLNGLSRFGSQATYGLALAMAFAAVAAAIPRSAPKEMIIWVVAVGYLIRCALLQKEVNSCFRDDPPSGVSKA